MSSDWTKAELAMLRTLWAEGVPTAEIGRQLSRSTNSVIGKAHRLRLPSRPSPLGRTRDEVPPPPAKPRVAPPEVALAPAAPPAACRTCQWPVEPWQRPWPLCGAPTVGGRSYCRAHEAIAWVRRPAREMA